jgi:monodechloroaminopyrrolnitrin synthase PrnB-like protein
MFRQSWFKPLSLAPRTIAMSDDAIKSASTLSNADHFDRWIRTAFVALNTELENLYFSRQDRGGVIGVGDEIKRALREEGHAHIVKLLAEGNTGDGFETAFNLLGNVGMYMAALRRHELTNPAREERSPFPHASALALHVGASLGMAPRFATSHLATHNKAVAGVRKSFTSLADEFLFIDENTRGIIGLQSAADAIMGVVHLGVSSPVADVLYENAATALKSVVSINERLFRHLDPQRFFYSVRPYYKPYRVGRQEYRGANAGDFPGINQLDLLLGLCRANDPYYSQLLVDKMLFMRPDDQARLRECMTYRSLLDELLELSCAHADAPWYQDNARAFLRVCDLFGQTAAQHHNELVRKFIELPAADLDEASRQGITASGPPLPVLLRSLELLRDMRTAADVSGATTRYADLARLRQSIRDTAEYEPNCAAAPKGPR